MQNHKSKLKIPKTLKKAIDFHGHLGPYLVLGMKMGNLAIDRLRCKRHFGIKAEIKGAVNKPKSCLIDGIQVVTGCTYGKGNIQKEKGSCIQAAFFNLQNNKKTKLFLKQSLIKKLDSLKGHKDSESFALELYASKPEELFELKF